MFPLNANNFIELLSSPNVFIYLTIALLNATLLIFASLKFVLTLQQTGYHGKRYFKWLSSPETPYLKRLMLLCLMGFLFFCVLNTCFTPIVGESISSFIGFTSYLLFTVMYIKTESAVNAKVPLRATYRIIRLMITYFVLLVVATFGLVMLLDYLALVLNDQVVAIMRYAPICLMPILLPYLLFIAYSINQPIEYFIRQGYINKTKRKLSTLNLTKIAITGSYGKTSVKEILKTLFSQKYRVLSSPKSYNTPLGIARAVKGLDGTHDIFIAEFGARCTGDIKYLTDIVKPDIAVLTGVNNQHLESFGDIENTKNTKFELFENMADGGKGFFSADNEYSVELYKKFNGKKQIAGLSGEDNLVTASDVTLSEKGTTFTLKIKGEEPIVCETILLGEHNVSNICLASAVAYSVGMTKEEIAQGINRLVSVEHRLELMPNQKKIVIIDDSYNSNENGVKAAMKVLDAFSGRKIILTPGLIELGKDENVANYKVGALMAKHADVMIIIGKHNAEMLISGLTENGFNKDNILFATSLKKGNALLNEIMKEGDVVLFENDLPDNYS